MSTPTTVRIAAICVLGLIWSANASAKCRAGGPAEYATDYRVSAGTSTRRVVENGHFTPAVRREALRGTVHNTKIRHTYAGIDYVLRWYPNDPRGLRLMGIYTHKLKKNKEAWAMVVQHPKYQPLHCYFDAARRFAPDDPNVINAYGIYLNTTGAHKKAIEAFKSLTEMAPDSAAAHYNLALSYYAAKRYKDSAQSARRAYELGYKKQNLKVMLKRKGAW